MRLEPDHGVAPARGEPRPTLRPGRRYLFLALRTALWTAAIFSSAAYFSYEKASPIPAPPAPAEAEIPDTPPLPGIAPAAPAGGKAPADSLALVRKYAGAKPEAAAPARNAKPRLVTPGGAKSGWFAQGIFPAGESGAEAAPSAPARVEADEVALPEAALKARIKVKGAKPVPRSVARRYAADREAESARQGRLIREAAEAAEKERRQQKRLLLYAAVFFFIAAFSTAASRVIQAWRGIHKPDGPHWTLR